MKGPRFLACVAALWILPLVAVGSPAGEPLVAIRTGTLPPLPAAESVSRVVSVNGQLVAIADGAMLLLEAKTPAWTRRAWRPDGVVTAVAATTAQPANARAAQQAFLLLAAKPGDPVTKVQRISLTGNVPGSSTLPPLPVPLERAQGATLADVLYVAGTAADGTSRMFAINALAPVQWVAHAAWPGSGQVTSLAGQTGMLLLTAKSGTAAGERLLRWKPVEGWSERGAVQGTIVDGSARPIGQAHVLYLLRSGDAVRLMMLHTITGSWASLGEPGAAADSVSTAWGTGIAWARPAANGAGTEVAYAEIESSKLLLKGLDWFVVIAYLTSMLGMGLYFYLREKRHSTSDFFVGGRTIPFWAAGISLYAANTSSISYIAIPAKAFETNWQYLTNNLVGVLGLMFVAVWIVPLLRRLDLMSVFQYIETRFHPVIRTLASALYIAVQIGSRMSVILFLPSLAIATMTGIDVTWSILIMGVFTMIYTAMGGMKAVVWTDFVQLIVKMGGIAFAIGFIVLALDGGVGELFRIAAAEEKMKLFDFSFDLTKATVWGFVFLVLFDVVLTFPKDQVLMQRVLSTKSGKDAGRSIWTFAAVTIPGGFMFYFVGTALYAFYKTHPERMNPLLTIDATFPLFIAAELPAGIRGLIVAGILAAAMATLSSIMNSVATLASVDFYEKIVKNPNPKVSVRFAEAMTVVTGLLGMGVALLLSRYDIHSLFDISIELFGVLGGGFAGVYTLGMFTRRANWQGVTIGVALSIMLTTVAWSMSLVHPYFYLAISILLCIVIGWSASWLFPAPTRESLKGLTIYEPKPAP